jgi:hypothetical protein
MVQKFVRRYVEAILGEGGRHDFAGGAARESDRMTVFPFISLR